MNCPLTNISHECEKGECAWWNKKYKCCILEALHIDLLLLTDVWAKEKWRDVYQRK